MNFHVRLNKTLAGPFYTFIEFINMNFYKTLKKLKDPF